MKTRGFRAVPAPIAQKRRLHLLQSLPILFILPILCLLVLAPSAARATDRTFIASSGNWDQPQNWSPYGVPIVNPSDFVADNAIINGNHTALAPAGVSGTAMDTFLGNNGFGVLNISGGVISSHSLNLGILGTTTVTSGSLFLGTLSLDGGNLNISGGYTSYFTGFFGSGQVTVSSGTLETPAESFFSGNFAMNISGGSVSIFRPSVGGNNTNSASIEVSGSGSFGAGEMTISTNGLVHVTGGNFHCGILETGNGGFLFIDGGNASVADHYFHKDRNLVVSSGTLRSNDAYTGDNSSVAYVQGGLWEILHQYGSAITIHLYNNGRLAMASGTGTLLLGDQPGSIGNLDLGYGGDAGILLAGSVRGGLGSARVTFNHTGNYSFYTPLDGNLSVLLVGPGGTTFTVPNSYTGSTVIFQGVLYLVPGASIASSTNVWIQELGVLNAQGLDSLTIPAGQKLTFTVDGTGAGREGRLLAQGLDITQAAVDFSTLARPDDPAYVLVEYTQLTGTAFASVTNLPRGYSLDYAYNNGTQIALVYTDTPPVTGADFGSVHRDPVTIPVLANDFDNEHDPLFVSAVTSGSFGSVTITGSDSVTYTPGPNFASSNGDSFTYTANDGAGGTTIGHVIIYKQNYPPIATDDSALVHTSPVTIPVLANDRDYDSDPLTITAVTQGISGSVTFTGTTLTYSPISGVISDHFTYTISDGFGGTATAAVTIIGVSPVTTGSFDAGPNGSGSPVAGEPDGTTLAKVGIPSIANGGFMAASAILNTGSTLVKAVLSGTDLRVLVRQGDPALDPTGSPIPGAAFESFDTPLIDDAGHIAFVATLSGVPSFSKTGLWSDAFGTLAQIARVGTPAPGVPGAKLAAINSVILATGTAIAGGGSAKVDLLAFTGQLAPGSGGVTGANNTALWAATANGTTLLLREGDLFTVNGQSTQLKNFTALGVVKGSPGQGRASDGSAVVAQAFFRNGIEAVLLLSPGLTPVIVASEGDFIPVLQPGAVIASLGAPTLTDAGSIGGLVQILRKSASVTSANDTAILLGGSNADYSQLLVRESDPAPNSDGAPIPGARFAQLGDPVINSQGIAAFTASITGRGITGANNAGIWWGAPGNLRLLAREGDIAPGTGGRFTSFVSLALPDDNFASGTNNSAAANSGSAIGPVFVAKVTGGGKSVLGLWALDSRGTLQLITATGGQTGGVPIIAIDVLGAVPGSPAQPRSYNAQRTLIYRQTLQNGHQQIISTSLP